MDAVQLQIFILYTIIKKKDRNLKVCSEKKFQIVISGFVVTSIRIAHIYIRVRTWLRENIKTVFNDHSNISVRDVCICIVNRRTFPRY